MSIFGDLLDFGSNIVGGLLGRRESRRSQERAGMQADQQAQLQREFAQHGIRWRVEDAKSAGIHPLYALGGSGASYSPVSVYSGGGDGGIAQSLSQAGQGLARAFDATRTEPERAQVKMEALRMERGELENELLRSQIALLRANANPPLPGNLPSAWPGQGDLPQGDVSVTVKPVETPATQAPGSNQEAGAFPETRWVRTARGWQPVPSREAFEDADIGNPSSWGWYWRNQFLPTVGDVFGVGDKPPKEWLPEGFDDWEWFSSRQEWVPKRHIFGRR